MAGFVKFDLDKWRLPKAESEPTPTAFAGLAGLAALPPEMADGLRRIPGMHQPRGVNAEGWTMVVRDVDRLLALDWVSRAVALGWSALDLFGASVDQSGDPAADGLAVQLQGRKMLAMSEAFATVAEDNGGRSYLYRPTAGGARLLWELG